jgi:hypothetical protein
MICSHCGFQIVEESRYCPKCGQPVAADAAPVVEPAAQPVESDVVLEKMRNNENTGAPPSQKAPDRQALEGLLKQANLCRLRGQWTEAIDHCIAILRVRPNSATTHSLLGDIYRDQGRIEDAIRWYRMAVDLRPNPADEAKLQRLERERTHYERIAALRAQSGYDRSPSTPLAPDGSVLNGTTNLMGISPRRWLRGITVVSLGFVALMVLLLVMMQTNRPHGAVIPRAVNVAYSGNGVSVAPSGILPPARPGGAAILPEGGAAARMGAKASSGGTGFSPDKTSASTLVVPREAPHTPASVPPTVAPAPVTSVRPLLPLPAPSKTDKSRGIPANPSPPNAAETPTLPGGMRIAQVQKTNGSAAILVLSPPVAAPTLDSELRAQLVRNVYHSAHSVFEKDPALNQATVYIQTSTNPADSNVLLVADVDRATAMQSNPDSDPLDSLQTRLLSLRWGSLGTTSHKAVEPPPP